MLRIRDIASGQAASDHYYNIEDCQDRSDDQENSRCLEILLLFLYGLGFINPEHKDQSQDAEDQREKDVKNTPRHIFADRDLRNITVKRSGRVSILLRIVVRRHRSAALSHLPINVLPRRPCAGLIASPLHRLIAALLRLLIAPLPCILEPVLCAGLIASLPRSLEPVLRAGLIALSFIPETVLCAGLMTALSRRLEPVLRAGLEPALLRRLMTALPHSSENARVGGADSDRILRFLRLFGLFLFRQYFGERIRFGRRISCRLYTGQLRSAIVAKLIRIWILIVASRTDLHTVSPSYNCILLNILLTCYLLRPLPLRTRSAQIVYFQRLTARPRAPHIQIRPISLSRRAHLFVLY